MPDLRTQGGPFGRRNVSSCNVLLTRLSLYKGQIQSVQSWDFLFSFPASCTTRTDNAAPCNAYIKHRNRKTFYCRNYIKDGPDSCVYEVPSTDITIVQRGGKACFPDRGCSNASDVLCPHGAQEIGLMGNFLLRCVFSCKLGNRHQDVAE